MTDYKKLKRSLLSQTGAMVFTNAMVIGLGFLINIAMVRILKPQGNGLVVLTITICNFISLFIDLRFGEALIKYVNEFMDAGKKEQAKAVVYMGYLIDFLLGIACFLIIIGLRFILSRVYAQPLLSKMLNIYAFMLLIGTVNTTSINLFQCFRKFYWISFQNVFYKLLDAVFILLILYLAPNPVNVIYGYFCSAVLITVIISIKALTIINRHFKGTKASWQGIPVKQLIMFTVHTTYSSTVKSLSRWMDTLLLGYFLKDPRYITYYKNGLSIGGLMGILTDPVYRVVYPVIVKLRNNRDFTTIKKIAIKVMAFGLFVLVPSALLFIYFTPMFLDFVYKGLSNPSYDVIKIVIWTQVINCSLAWQRAVYLAFGRADIGSKIGTLGFIIFLVMLVTLIPRYSIIGAAWAYFVTHTIDLVIIFFFCCHLLRKNMVSKPD